MSNEDLLIGDRIRITGVLQNDLNPLEIFEEGTVTDIVDVNYLFRQIYVDWDSGRSIMLLGDDPFEILENVNAATK